MWKDENTTIRRKKVASNFHIASRTSVLICNMFTWNPVTRTSNWWCHKKVLVSAVSVHVNQQLKFKLQDPDRTYRQFVSVWTNTITLAFDWWRIKRESLWEIKRCKINAQVSFFPFKDLFINFIPGRVDSNVTEANLNMDLKGNKTIKTSPCMIINFTTQKTETSHGFCVCPCRKDTGTPTGSMWISMFMKLMYGPVSSLQPNIVLKLVMLFPGATVTIWYKTISQMYCKNDISSKRSILGDISNTTAIMISHRFNLLVALLWHSCDEIFHITVTAPKVAHWWNKFLLQLLWIYYGSKFDFKYCDSLILIAFQGCREHWTIGPWPPDFTSGPSSFAFYWPGLAASV